MKRRVVVIERIWQILEDREGAVVEGEAHQEEWADVRHSVNFDLLHHEIMEVIEAFMYYIYQKQVYALSPKYNKMWVDLVSFCFAKKW